MVMTDIDKVAKMIATHPVRMPLYTPDIITAEGTGTWSGSQRLRDLRREFKLRSLGREPYYVKGGEYKITTEFKEFCRQFLRERREHRSRREN